MAIFNRTVTTILILVLICHSLDQVCSGPAIRKLKDTFGYTSCEEDCEQKRIACVNNCYLMKDDAKREACFGACDDEERDCRARCSSAAHIEGAFNQCDISMQQYQFIGLFLWRLIPHPPWPWWLRGHCTGS